MSAREARPGLADARVVAAVGVSRIDLIADVVARAVVGARLQLRGSLGAADAATLHASAASAALVLDLRGPRLVIVLRLARRAATRAERHDDPSQDSRSLYFSLDLRRLF